MSEAPQDPKPRESKRRFFRFGLKALLLFTALVAVWLGIVTNRASRQRRAVEALASLGADFSYDYQRVRSERTFLGDRFDSKATAPGHPLLRTLLGDHYFITPIKLVIEGQRMVDQDALAYLKDLPDLEAVMIDKMKLRDRDLSHFRNLSKLRYLHFHDGTLDRIEQADSFAFLSKCPELDDLCLSGRGFGDEAAVHLRELTRLRRLFLSDTAIGDDALVHLTGMTELDVLRLENTNVGDAGLAHLEPLKNLSMLSLHSTQVTDGGLEHLKKLPSLWGVQAADTQVTPKSLKAALPHCETLSGW